MSVRTVRNKCVATRVEIGDKVVRVFSIFCSHPSQVPENKWTLLRVNGDEILVDYITRELLSECECSFLFDKNDTSDEPSVMAAEMRPLQNYEKQLKDTGDAKTSSGEEDEINEEGDEKIPQSNVDDNADGESVLEEVGDIVNEIADGIANLST
jgi:hypothetical protein